MKAFISHSSADKTVAVAVYEGLKAGTAWLDRAEIEWGTRFVEEIESALRNMSDFVLLWSEAASRSSWVQFELDMAFIRLLDEQGIRIRVVRLDGTELPLRLQPFQHLSVIGSSDPAPSIVESLRQVLVQPGKGARNRFLNRNAELERIETTINDPEIRIIVLRGFLGAGKAALANEAFRRFFERQSFVDVSVSSGIAAVELALRLHHEAYREILSETQTANPLNLIEHAVCEIAGRGQFILIRNVQHWLDDRGAPEEPLLTIMRVAASVHETARKPLFLTSTRYIQIPHEFTTNTINVAVKGLADEHVASLISLWHEIMDGNALERGDAVRLAAHLHGHPIAAKLAANLVTRYGVDHLLDYPRELVSLRRDLTKTLIRDIKATGSLLTLMETLAIIGTPVSSSVLAKVLALDAHSFHIVVADATATGLANIVGTGQLVAHPLVADYFWRSHHDREGYMVRAKSAATVLHGHLDELPAESVGKIEVLRAVVRLYSLAGLQSQALAVRRDLTGELAHVAWTHYNRRQYELAERFVDAVLESDPRHWQMRKCLARIHIRRYRWNEADAVIDDLLRERPRDLAVQHLLGWRHLRSKDYEKALDIFTKVLARKDDFVRALRDAADCLYRLERSAEALKFLERAKEVESDNAYTLELEARIYENAGDYEKALAAMQLAVVRYPGSWSLRHRLARIHQALGNRQLAIDEVSESVALDASQFLPLSTLTSWLLDKGDSTRAAVELAKLRELSTNANERQLVDHLAARRLHIAGDYEGALQIVNRQVDQRINLAASAGLLARIRLDQIDHVLTETPSSARVLLKQAENAMSLCQSHPESDPGVIQNLRDRIDSVRRLLDTS